MRRDLLRAKASDALERYERANGPLPGIVRTEHRASLVEQLVDSMRRTQYFERLRRESSGPDVADPSSVSFDALRAAVFHDRAGDRDEAFWLLFLFVHFGKNQRSKWHLIADVYGRLGDGAVWSWVAVSGDVSAFRRWLESNVEAIRSLRPERRFGNHRKYESLDAWSVNGTGAVVESYVDWVGANGHDARISQIVARSTTPAERFDTICTSLEKNVRRFGRTAAFDYCSTLEKLAFAPVEPNAAHLTGATGPLKGARLLLAKPGHGLSSSALETMLVPLRAELGVGFDVLEDALCNWQKSPASFRPFRG